MEVIFTSTPEAIGSIDYTYQETPFGEMLVAWHADALCFATFTTYLGRKRAFAELQALFYRAQFNEIENRTSIFDITPEKILLAGTPFRQDVWRALLGVERGTTISYSELARRSNHPTAIRAVATSVGCNPISVIVPCHRILPLTGGIGNYHSGAEIKRRLLEWEGALP